MLVILLVAIAVRSFRAPGNKKLNDTVDIPLQLSTMTLIILEDGIDQFQFATIILMLTLFGVGGLLFILN
jgi:hypothetical protein